MTSQTAEIISLTKRCSQCEEDKELNAFNPMKGGKLGRRAYCKACRNKKLKLPPNKLHNTKPNFPNMIDLELGVKSCTKCGDTKTLSEFSKDAQGQHGYHNQCRKCHNARKHTHFGMTPEGRQIRYKREKSNAGKVILTEKTCTKCQELKPITEFTKLCTTRDGVNTQCKKCVSSYTSIRYRGSEKVRKTLIKKATDRNRKSKYGVSPEEFVSRLALQGGGCAICNKVLDESKRSLIGHVDHCHVTNKVRGVLCSSCNIGIGLFRDNRKLLSRAIDYLSYHGGACE